MDKLKIALGEKESETSIYEFDKDLCHMIDEVVLARNATADNPVSIKALNFF